jgi:hypothetical protein
MIMIINCIHAIKYYEMRPNLLNYTLFVVRVCLVGATGTAKSAAAVIIAHSQFP